MKEPSGEILQLSFYLPNQTSEVALRTLIEALLQSGAKFSGIARGCRVDTKEGKPFVPLARIYRNIEVEIRTLQELQFWLMSDNFYLLEVLMTNFNDLEKDECVVVTYEGISEQAAQYDTPAVTILSTGNIFSLARNSLSDSKKYNEKARKAGKKTYEQFKDIIEVLKPAYGSIAIEWSLESPADLRLDPRSLAFRNFYVSYSVGIDLINQLRQLFDAAYIEDLSSGIYISCTSEFNPKRLQINLATPPWDRISTEVGKLLAKATFVPMNK